MRGYKCDRCGQWHAGRCGGYLYENLLDEEDDDEFDLNSKTYDLCPECFRSVFSYMKNSAITSD